MCTKAYDVTNSREISTMGDIRSLTDTIVWSGDNGSEMGDEYCLCWVDIPRTLMLAGFKVWINPDVVPEYFCEKVS